MHRPGNHPHFESYTMKLLIHPFATTAAAALALLAMHSGSAHAQATTGSLAGWTVQGDVIAQSGALKLTTAFLDGFTDQPLNLSGTSAADIVVVETTAGVPALALDLPEPEYGREGSVVAQSFAVAAGSRLTFSWAFTTVEDLFLDRAFAVVNGQLFTLATRSAPGLATQTFSFTFATAGMATLALGVIDTGDYLGVSTLAISNLAVTPVPEPATLALWLAGLGLVGCAVRRHPTPFWR